MKHIGLTPQKWARFTIFEQLANIGSEVHRAMKWKNKKNDEYSNLAFERSLELFDLTLDTKHTFPQFKEVCRLREAWVDYFKYDNLYGTDEDFWEKYFHSITVYANNQTSRNS